MGAKSVTSRRVSSFETGDPLSYPDPELVVALVYPAGTDSDGLRRGITRSLRRFGYGVDAVRISEIIEKRCGRDIPKRPLPERIEALIREGDQLCRPPDASGRGENPREGILAQAAIAEIAYRRSPPGRGHGDARPRHAHVISSLKRPAECAVFRRVYGPGLFVIGANTPVPNRVKRLMRAGANPASAQALVARDMEETTAGGQKLQKTMQLADAFILLGDGHHEKAIDRIFDLVFGAPFVTPIRDEHAMFLAFSASLRSASLSRQVGAALLDENGEVVGVGCNDVPAFGGGLYWPDHAKDGRDHSWPGWDTNKKVLGEIVDDVARRLSIRSDVVRDKLKGAQIEDITEFGRAAHAEMEAILSAARSGANPRGGTLYTTTFPCHNCTRHIIATGVRRVVYVEPYPKSRAQELHPDAVWFTEFQGLPSRKVRNTRVVFDPFVGIGPRRFFDLFSMSHGSGEPLSRKAKDGIQRIKWERSDARVRCPLLPVSFLDREDTAAQGFLKLHDLSRRTS